MQKQKLTVVTEAGTFTTTTGRTYSHIVVVGGLRADYCERERLSEITGWIRFSTDVRTKLADGSYQREYEAAPARYQQRLDEALARVAALEDYGPITQDTGRPRVLAWCGRLDLALKRLNANDMHRFTWARIYAVADGALVAAGSRKAD